ncbi:redox-regulated ATPase YchF [Candidatus Woesearchaeota archaeon]|nr:redox-regulated ATPase YchF [Candidatus Woesearchaeota archaeon]
MLVGIVGKANVGKSTFFKALTLADILIANYPFATIKPNHGVAFVRVQCVDRELNAQCNPRVGMCVNGTRFVNIDVMDVAGLVPGAHEGKGMGNQFLDDLRQADVFLHVVDMSGSTNERGEPVGTGDPAFDIRFLEIEVDMWILSIIKKGWDRIARQSEHEGGAVPALARQVSGLKVDESFVKLGLNTLKMDPAKPSTWTEEQLHSLAVHIRKKTKPMVIVANKMDIPQSKENLERCKKLFPDYVFVPVSAESELALKEASSKGLIKYIPGSTSFEMSGQLSDKQKAALEFIQKNVLDKWEGTGVQKALDVAVFEMLKMIAIFPGGVGKLGDAHGNILPDCFLLPAGSTAFDFAGRIHTDLQKNFVAAVDVKTRRKIGRDTLLKNRDVIEIMTSK